MADDLEAFLRQAAQRRAQKAAGAQQPAAPQRPAPAAQPRQPLSPQSTPPQSAPPQARRPTTFTPQSKAPTPEVVQAEVVPIEPVSRLKSRVDTSSISQHAGQLGEEVGLADEHMEAHLSKAFDHQIGSQVEPQVTASQPAAAPTFDSALDVDALLGMLTRPSSVRNAIVLSEILRRPDFD
jgi:hypothetical protein